MIVSLYKERNTRVFQSLIGSLLFYLRHNFFNEVVFLLL